MRQVLLLGGDGQRVLFAFTSASSAAFPVRSPGDRVVARFQLDRVEFPDAFRRNHARVGSSPRPHRPSHRSARHTGAPRNASLNPPFSSVWPSYDGRATSNKIIRAKVRSNFHAQGLAKCHASIRALTAFRSICGNPGVDMGPRLPQRGDWRAARRPRHPVVDAATWSRRSRTRLRDPPRSNRELRDGERLYKRRSRSWKKGIRSSSAASLAQRQSRSPHGDSSARGQAEGLLGRATAT